MLFIEFTDMFGQPISILMSNVAAIKPCTDDAERTYVFMCDSSEPFVLSDSYMSVMNGIMATTNSIMTDPSLTVN